MLLDRHKDKIVDVASLATRLGPRPRAQKVVMCHGVFDVVHPGHLRHLLDAKKRADVLVAGITSDRFVTKGAHRPHVPQDLRAANLALLDIVDYVLITDSEKPLEAIAAIQPDYFAKGFEYSATARPRRTIEETAAVEAYGGEMLFTSGDFVRSSSALLEQNLPDLRYEKLAMLMERAGIGFGDLRRTLASIEGHRAHVVGDVIVDGLLHCTVVGGQIKTPTISVRRNGAEYYVGGAGIVAKHACAAGAQVRLTTALGDDDHGVFVLDDLEAAGVEVNVVVDGTRPTTCKEAVVVDGYRLLKLDTVDNRAISDAMLETILESVRETEPGAVIYSDFRHGVFNARTIGPLLEAVGTRDDLLRVADSQVASRWGNITEFKGLDLITPNEREARFALADQDSGVRPLASRLYDEAGCGVLMLKMGAHGVLTCTSADHEDSASFFVVDSFADEVVDPVGAGDALLAYASLAMLAGGGPVIATILGSFAAGIECGLDGNVPVSPQYVLDKIDRAEEEI